MRSPIALNSINVLRCDVISKVQKLASSGFTDLKKAKLAILRLKCRHNNIINFVMRSPIALNSTNILRCDVIS